MEQVDDFLQGLMADDRYWKPGPDQNPYRNAVQEMFQVAYPGRGGTDATGRMLDPTPAVLSLEDLEREATRVMPVAAEAKTVKEGEAIGTGEADATPPKTVHVRPDGPSNRIDIPDPGETIRKKPPLPAPTDDLVDPDAMFDALDYDPDGLWGDVATKLEQGMPWSEEQDVQEISGEAEYLAARYLRTDKEGKQQTGNGDAQDAVRHAIGAIMAAREYGTDRAKEILDRHERKPREFFSPTDPVGNQLQDLYNNRVGLDAARDPNNRGKAPVEIALELYEAGKLQERPFSTNR